MARLRTALCDLLGIEYPIIQAPMAGGPTTPELVAVVSAAGALGSFGHAYTAAETMRSDAAAVRARTAASFNLNLFAAPVAAEAPAEQQRAAIAAVRPLLEQHDLAVPERVPPPYAPDLATQLEAVCDLRPAVCTIHLGELAPAVLARVRGLGIRLGSAATSVREARHLEGLGADFIIAQGGEAGGHRGTAHKKAIVDMDGDDTTMTRAFSGKPARGVRNRFTELAEREGWPLLPFPAHAKLTAPLRQASARAGSADYFSAWSGQAGSLARPLPATELVRVLVEETREAVDRLRAIAP
jgi:NAD(P)H-dependent flavin oxidoreductase YrpB (nitropropane dioxygenase family)